MQLWCSEACGRCCLRSRSSPPLPKTTVLGAAVGALGARKALTPAAHASATISRAMIAAEWARVAKCNRHQVGCVERLPPPPRPSRRLLSDKIGSCAQCTSSPAQLGNAWRPRSRSDPSPLPLVTKRFETSLSPASERLEPYAEARQQQGEAQCAGAVCKRRCARAPIRGA